MHVPLFLFCSMVVAGTAFAQGPGPSTSVPRVVRLDGQFVPANGLPPSAVETVTLSIYASQTDEAPLWAETQDVRVDAQGRYTVFLGASAAEGLPARVLSAEARWLGVRFARPGEDERARVPLTAVPYALKAADADTLGGLPPSAFLRSRSAGTVTTAAPADGTSTGASRDQAPLVNNGTTGYIGKFFNNLDLDNSNLFQLGSSIGVGTTAPLDALHTRFTNTAGSATGYAVQNLGSSATSYSGMLFYDHNGALRQFQGYNNGTGEYRINNISPTGSINFLIGSSSKFQVATNGTINLPTTTSGGSGVLAIGGSRFMHGYQNSTFVGRNAGNFLAATGDVNLTGLGRDALASNTTGNNNTATGTFAMAGNTTGTFNTAMGSFALRLNTTGSANTAIGAAAMQDANANGNTAVGSFAMGSAAVTGDNNTAVGQIALQSLTTGYENVAVGQRALNAVTTGNRNVAVGRDAMAVSTTAIANVAVGKDAMAALTTACCNVAIGEQALRSNSTWNSNVAVGLHALQDLVTGGENIAIGPDAARNKISGDVNIYIGRNIADDAANVESFTIRVGDSGGYGRFFAGGIRGVTTGQSNAVNVVIDGNGQLGTINSSRRYKEDIQDMGDASTALMKLRPVTYRYTQAYADGSMPLDYGLIAEEVEQVYPDLVAHLQNGEVETVQYHKINAMLLNEVQKQFRENQAQRAEIDELKARLAALERLLISGKR